MFLGTTILAALSFLVSPVGPSRENMTKVDVTPRSYQHTIEVCYVYIETKRETYCKVLDVRG